MPITRLDHCQFLLSSQVNYTLTYFADHAQKWSHDTIGRYLRSETITPRLVWDNLKQQVQPHANAYLLFDDTVLDKNHSPKLDPLKDMLQHTVVHKGLPDGADGLLVRSNADFEAH